MSGEHIPAKPAPSSLAFDPRSASPMVGRGMDRLNALVTAREDRARLLWSFKGAGDEPDGSIYPRFVSLSDGIVLVRCKDRTYRFLDGDTGEDRWSLGPARLFDSIGSIVVAADGIDLFALDRRSGEILWRVSPPLWIPRNSWLASVGVSRLRKNLLVMFSFDKGEWLVLVDRESGRLLWTELLSKNAQATMIDEVLLVVVEHVFSRWEVETGVVLWTSQGNGNIYFDDGIQRVDGVIAILSINAGSIHLSGLDEMSGHSLWVTKVDSKRIPLNGLPFDFAAVIVLWSDDILALDPRTGLIVWKYEITERARYLQHTTDLVFVNHVGRTDALNALEIMSGVQRWSVGVTKPVQGIEVANGVVVVRCAHPNEHEEVITAFDEQSGQRLWEMTGQSPVVRGDSLIVLLVSSVRSVNLRTGVECWSVELPDTASSNKLTRLYTCPLSIFEDRLYVGTDHSLHAVALPSLPK